MSYNGIKLHTISKKGSRKAENKSSQSQQHFEIVEVVFSCNITKYEK